MELKSFSLHNSLSLASASPVPMEVLFILSWLKQWDCLLQPLLQDFIFLDAKH